MNAIVRALFENWQPFLLLVVILVPIIPPQWLGLRPTYFDTNLKKDFPAEKYSILRAFVHSLLSPLQELIIYWGFRGTVSIVIFVAIGVDLFYRKQLSREAVTLAGIGILALYLEQLIDKAKKISIWKIFEWERKDENT